MFLYIFYLILKKIKTIMIYHELLTKHNLESYQSFYKK
jgi:hypothetical protein